VGVGGSVVDGDIEAAKGVDCVLDQARYLLGAAYVGLNRRGLASGLENLLGDCSHAFETAAADHYAGPGIGKSQGNGPSDAPRGTGNNGYLPFE
jgi:hypothetical protein